jgi:hypothetical protein
VTALVGYQLATLLRSQGWVGPFVTYLGLLAFVYASEAGPAVIAFGVTGYGLFVVSAWLTAVTLGAENEVARQVTAATAGSQVRVQAAALTAALLGGSLLAVVAVGWAAVANPTHTSGAATLAGGLALHALFAMLGTAVGAAFGRPLVNAPGQAALGIIAVSMLALIVAGSPVQACLKVLESNPAHGFAGRLSPLIALLFGIAVAGVALDLARTPAKS